jgi:prepilin-type processing-associated H-X9-DG protein
VDRGGGVGAVAAFVPEAHAAYTQPIDNHRPIQNVLPLNECVDSSPPYWQNTTNSRVAGSALTDTNDAKIRLGTIIRYAGSSAVYRCPADKSTVLDKRQFARTRHYSMPNGMSGAVNGTRAVPAFRKASDINTPSPTRAFVFIDEHPWSMDGDAFFYVYPPATWRWGSFPDARHQNGANLSFADGHVDHLKWLEPSTLKISKSKGTVFGAGWVDVNPGDRDLGRLKECIAK